MTFDALLNCLDGVEPSNGVCIVITTNRVDKLDEALGVPREGDTISTRPGRIDRVMELREMDYDCRLKLASRILSECTQHIEETVRHGQGDTGAQFQERCTRIALRHHWNGKQDIKDFRYEPEEKPVKLDYFGEPVSHSE